MQIGFEDCLLDTDRRELRRGNQLVAIEPQVLDVLDLPDRKPRSRRQQRRPHRVGLARPDRLGFDPGQPHQCGAQSHWRQRRAAEARPHNPAQRRSLCRQHRRNGKNRRRCPLSHPISRTNRKFHSANPRTRSTSHMPKSAMARRSSRPPIGSRILNTTGKVQSGRRCFSVWPRKIISSVTTRAHRPVGSRGGIPFDGFVRDF